MNNTLFETFNNGTLHLPAKAVEFADIPWSKHPVFEGVELKHIVTATDTDGRFSYHLVCIVPNKCIKNHLHDINFPDRHRQDERIPQLYIQS